MMKTKVFLDMDGVLSDYVSAALTALGLPVDTPITQWDMPTELGLSPNEFWWSQDNDPDFWRNIKPYPGASGFVSELQALGFNVYFATSPSLHKHCASDKLWWLDRHIAKGESRRAMIGPCKELLARPGRILVDDHVKNCQAWQDAGGTSLLFPQPWNAQIVPVEEKYRRVIAQLLDIRDQASHKGG